MRIAALYDIHGNLPALDAVLAESCAPASIASSSAATCCRGRCRARRSSVCSRSRCRSDFLRGNGDRETLRRAARAAVAHPRDGPAAAALVPRAARRWPGAGHRGVARDAALRGSRPRVRALLSCHAAQRRRGRDAPHSRAAAAADLRRRGRSGGVRPHARAVRRQGRAHARGERRQRRDAVREARRVLASARRRRRASCARTGPTTCEAAATAVRRTTFPDAEQFASVYILNPPDMLQTFTQYGLEALKGAAHGA